MRKYKSKIKGEWHLEEIICDRCKHKLSKEEMAYGMWHTIEYQGGFGSRWPGDLGTATADICEYCLHVLIGDFAIIELDE